MRKHAGKYRFKVGSVALILVVAWGLPHSVAVADMYQYEDAAGHTYLSNVRDSSGTRKLIKVWKGGNPSDPKPTPKVSDSQKNKQALTPAIRHLAKHYRLPSALVHAVIQAESAYDTTAVSRAGAVGLMQLMPGTAKMMGVKNRTDPIANVNGGLRYLRYLLRRFDNNLILALAAYNAGETAVMKYGGKVPPYPETRNYIRKVLKFYRANRKVRG